MEKMSSLILILIIEVMYINLHWCPIQHNDFIFSKKISSLILIIEVMYINLHWCPIQRYNFNFFRKKNQALY